MKYNGSLAKKEREEIFQLFLNNNKLKFSDIEKALNKDNTIRSNMIAYHIEKMQEDGLLEKKGFYYYLTKNAERCIPVFPHIIGTEMSPLPVALVAITNSNHILLIKRNKRPYKGYWSLIGGKILLEENIEEASLRLVKQKTGLEGSFISTNAVMHEHVEGDNMIKHSFMLFFTKVQVDTITCKKSEHGELQWFSPEEIASLNIIPSDLWLINHKLSRTVEIKQIVLYEHKGNLERFNLV